VGARTNSGCRPATCDRLISEERGFDFFGDDRLTPISSIFRYENALQESKFRTETSDRRKNAMSSLENMAFFCALSDCLKKQSLFDKVNHLPLPYGCQNNAQHHQNGQTEADNTNQQLFGIFLMLVMCGHRKTASRIG